MTDPRHPIVCQSRLLSGRHCYGSPGKQEVSKLQTAASRAPGPTPHRMAKPNVEFVESDCGVAFHDSRQQRNGVTWRNPYPCTCLRSRLCCFYVVFVDTLYSEIFAMCLHRSLGSRPLGIDTPYLLHTKIPRKIRVIRG